MNLRSHQKTYLNPSTVLFSSMLVTCDECEYMREVRTTYTNLARTRALKAKKTHKRETDCTDIEIIPLPLEWERAPLL